MDKNEKETEDLLSDNIGAVSGRLVSTKLVSVLPIDGIDSETRKRIEAEVKAENRERKIDSVLQDKPFEEMKIEEHSEWKYGHNWTRKIILS